MRRLERTLSAPRGAALMLNIVLGSGLLVLPGLAVREVGTQSVYLWLACGLIALPLLAVFALLGRAVPDAGGIAAIAGRAFGRPFYVVATFLFLGTVVLGLPAIALTGGHYASSLFGGPPAAYAVALVLFAGLANLRSADAAGRFGSLLALMLLLSLGLLLVAGFSAIAPVVPAPDVVLLGNLGVSQLTSICMMLFFAFTGWEVAANLSEEFRNPRRDIPLAVGLSFVAAMVLYAALAVLAQSGGLNEGFEAPFAAIFGARFGVIGTAAVSLVAVVLIAANLTAAVWAVSRMVFSAAREHLLPEELAAVNRGIPDRAILLTVAAMALVVLASAVDLFSLSGLLERAGKNFLILYGISALALIRLETRLLPRALGAVAAVIVVTILCLQGTTALIYPAVLAAGGLAITCTVRSNFYRIHAVGHPGE